MRRFIISILDAFGLIGLAITAAMGLWMIWVAPEPRLTSGIAWGGLAAIMLAAYGLFIYTKGDNQ